jgi:ankyrin repeat protein
MEVRPGLAKEEIIRENTPMHQASHEGKINVLRVLLEHDQSLGYLVSRNGVPLLNSAASCGHVDVARELLIHCPDAPYCDKTGWTCLHAAVSNGHAKFVAFVLESKHLRRLVNMQDQLGQTPLHIAVQNRRSRVASLLLHHQGIDVTLVNNDGKTASQKMPSADEDDTTIWVRTYICFLSMLDN